MPEYSFAVPDLGAKWFSNAFLVQLAETEAGGGEGAGVGEVLGRCVLDLPSCGQGSGSGASSSRRSGSRNRGRDKRGD